MAREVINRPVKRSARIKRTITPQNSVPFVGQLIKAHLEYNPQSRLTWRRNTFTSFCNTFAHQRVNQLTPAKLREWFERLKNKHNHTDRNLNAIKSNLNHFFWYLVNEGYLVINPMNQVKFSRKYTPTKSRVTLSQIDVMDMLDKMKDHSPTIVYPFIYCLAHTGARREEIRTLKWQDIDFENGFIYLRQTKNGEDRAIRIGSSLAAFLDTLPRKDEYIFLNQVGTLLSREQIDDTIASLQRKHPSMKRWRCHDLRHSFAYNYLKRGGEMYALKAILGHKSIQLTVDLYGNYQACDVDMPSPYD